MATTVISRVWQSGSRYAFAVDYRRGGGLRARWRPRTWSWWWAAAHAERRGPLAPGDWKFRVGDSARCETDNSVKYFEKKSKV